MGQLSCLTLFITSICFHLFPVGRGELVLGRETDDFDFDGLPGAQHEFKIEIRAGQEECFYQKIKKGGKIFTRFQVSALLVYNLPQTIQKGSNIRLII